MASSFVSIIGFASFVIGLTPECTALQWSSDLKQEAVVYACAGGTLSLPWNVSKQTGDSILDMQWFQHKESTQMVAVEANGNFFPVPAFSGRVHKTTNAGLEISHVTVLDSGIYWAEVLWQGAGKTEVHTLNSTVTVYVTDGLQTTDGQLHAEVSPAAHYSNVTDEYHVVLRCGIFTYPTYPPFEVIWVTPSGTTKPSSGYQNGRFYILLPNPVKDGSYVCRIPPAEACLNGKSGEVTATVDKMEARLAVMEARLAMMEARHAVLESRNAALEAENKKRVSFHARLHQNQVTLAGKAIVLDQVYTNQGNAYNSSTGRFIAPFDGTYCFLGTAETGSSSVSFGIWLMVDNSAVDYVSASSDEHYGVGSVHSVVRLRADQTVLLLSKDDTEFWFWATAFSGFLVSPDS